MKLISIFCPNCKKFMQKEIDWDCDLGQDMIPKFVGECIDEDTHICEHCGVLSELEVKQYYRVDAKIIF